MKVVHYRHSSMKRSFGVSLDPTGSVSVNGGGGLVQLQPTLFSHEPLLMETHLLIVKFCYYHESHKNLLSFLLFVVEGHD